MMIKELKNLKKLKVKENDIVIIRFDCSIPKE